MPYIELNKIKIYYETHGEGAPLLLISGYTCDHSCWEPLLPKLSEKFQVFVFDNRAVGKTKDEGESFTIETMADDAFELIRALNLVSPHVAGHSMGGNIALTLAGKYSIGINKLALLNTSAKWRKAMILTLKALLKLREQVDLDSLTDITLPWLAGEAFLSNPENICMFKELSEEDIQSIDDEKRQFQALQQFDGSKWLPEISSDTLILHSKEDLLSLPYESSLLKERITKAKLVECEGAHLSLSEATETVASELIQFFQ